MKSSGGLRVLFALAAAVIVVAGMREAQQLLVPFVLSAFIAVIFVPPIFWLQRRGVPIGIAIGLMVMALLALDVLLAALLGSSINDFRAALPGYQLRLQDEAGRVVSWLASLGIHIPKQMVVEQINPGAAMRLVANMLSGLGGLLTNAFLIGLTVIFMLLEAASFPDKLRSAFGDVTHSMGRFAVFSDSLLRYVLIKTLMSLATGGTVGLMLWALGVDFPLLWGLLAFLLNYVPNIGSIIAAVPAILIALVQLGSFRALIVGVGYLLINTLYGNVVETRVMGKGLGLSTLVVFLSLVFWGWLWGPVGMLLSVPLTMTLKIAMESNEGTRWLAILLGPEPAADGQSREA